MPHFVLVHSPSVGPATWAAVADRLTAAGRNVTVPSLLAVTDGPGPYWPRVVAAVAGGLTGVPPGRPVVLVAHSNAGVFVPVIRRGLKFSVASSVFVDATVPAEQGRTPVAPAVFLPFLRGLAGADGRLPPWTDWWDEADVAPMFAGREQARAVITAEQPRLPLAYYQEAVPVPPGWDDHPCGYVQFSGAYDGQAAAARRRGWAVRSLPGEHLHQVVDPDGTASLLLELAASARPPS